MRPQELPTPLPQELGRNILPHLVVIDVSIGDAAHVTYHGAVGVEARDDLGYVFGVDSLEVAVHDPLAQSLAEAEAQGQLLEEVGRGSGRGERLGLKVGREATLRTAVVRAVVVGRFGSARRAGGGGSPRAEARAADPARDGRGEGRRRLEEGGASRGALEGSRRGEQEEEKGGPEAEARANISISSEQDAPAEAATIHQYPSIAIAMKISKLIKIHLIASFAPTANCLLQYQRLNVKNAVQKHRISMRLNPTSFTGTDYVISEFPRPSLRRVPNEPILLFDDALQAKTQQMLNIMYEAKGVGLAAPQISLNENIFVYNPSDSKKMQRIVCNPTITKYSDEVIVEQEGCLSLRSDDCAGQVARSSWIETEYQNELGQKVRRRLKDFEARVFQHEYDHLKGILCYDRFPPEDREVVKRGIDNLLGLYTDDDAETEPDANEFKAIQPRPLSSRWMPPLELETESAPEDEKEELLAGRKGGFGARGRKNTGGFGAGGGSKKAGKKKEKKPKVGNGAYSDNPKFKTSGKTPFANRK
ncbi:hypothetical protein ACHAWF_015246 [Thalassiosira exigua]